MNFKIETKSKIKVKTFFKFKNQKCRLKMQLKDDHHIVRYINNTKMCVRI